MMVPRPRLTEASRALCAGLVPSAEGRVTAPRPEIFLPWQNGVFYDGPGGRVTDRARSGNYEMRGHV
jgi:hypothetical protein